MTLQFKLPSPVGGGTTNATKIGLWSPKAALNYSYLFAFANTTFEVRQASNSDMLNQLSSNTLKSGISYSTNDRFTILMDGVKPVFLQNGEVITLTTTPNNITSGVSYKFGFSRVTTGTANVTDIKFYSTTIGPSGPQGVPGAVISPLTGTAIPIITITGRLGSLYDWFVVQDVDYPSVPTVGSAIVIDQTTNTLKLPAYAYIHAVSGPAKAIRIGRDKAGTSDIFALPSTRTTKPVLDTTGKTVKFAGESTTNALYIAAGDFIVLNANVLTSTSAADLYAGNLYQVTNTKAPSGPNSSTNWDTYFQVAYPAVPGTPI
jgi:hypothetical protein